MDGGEFSYLQEEASAAAAEADMLKQENVLLKQRVEELKKQVTDLTTTNDFLLEQNADLRMSVKTAAAGGPTTVTVAPPPAQAIAIQGLSMIV